MDNNNWGIKRIDVLPPKGRTLLLYGQAGRGKTTLINTLKGKILLVNIDCGEQVLNINNAKNEIFVMNLVTNEIVTPHDVFKRFVDFSDYLVKQVSLPWGYVIVDNISLIENSSLVSITNRRNIKSPDQNAYGEAGFAMLDVLSTLRNITFKGVNLIYIAWEKTEKISDFGGEVHSEKGPMLIGQTQLKANGLVDFLGALRVDKKGTRYLQFDSDSKYSAKKREEYGKTYPSIIECPKDSDSTLQDFFDLISRARTGHVD